MSENGNIYFGGNEGTVKLIRNDSIKKRQMSVKQIDGDKVLFGLLKFDSLL